MALEVGRLDQIYLKEEAAYGVEEVVAAANAMRHVNKGTFDWDPFARITSPEKRQSPGPVNRFDRKQTAGLSGLVALLRPGGALNTLPEVAPLLKSAFGSVTNVTLSTTVAATPAPTTTTATIASAGALAKGDAILISVTGQTKSPFVRVITAITGAALTWAPALPAAPTTGDAVKGGITYQLTKALTKGLTLAHYGENLKRELIGLGIDTLELSLDANVEPQITVGGPAKKRLKGTGVQAKPASFTTVGGAPPSGLVGEALIDGTSYLIKAVSLSLTNGLKARTEEYGVNGATEIFRAGERAITVGIDAFAEQSTESVLSDLAEAGTNVSVLIQTGRSEGRILAVRLPKVEFKPPGEADTDTEKSWDFSGVALDPNDGDNDEMKLALM